MPADRFLTPFRRDVLLAVVAIGLLAAPLWAPALHLSDPTSRYERVEVVTDETGIKYANESAAPIRTPISDRIACSGAMDPRPCAFEQLLLDNRTVPTEVYSSNPNSPRLFAEERYQYVLVDDAVYEPAYVANRTAQRDDGMYRVDLDLERVAPDEALRTVSRPVSSDDVPPAVAEAARSGDARAPRESDVPDAPIRLEDDDGTETYYRVYEAGWSDPVPMASVVELSLLSLAPLLGLWQFGRLSRRIEVTYVGDERRR